MRESSSTIGLGKLARVIFRPWEKPTMAMLLSLEVYAIFALWLGQPHSPDSAPYYNYLADAFLHGQTHLRLTPGNTKDLIWFAGQYYLYWPPLPAILVMPFVAIFGVDFSDVLFTLVLASFNVALVAQVLRLACFRRVIRLNRMQRGLLVLFFALGTVHFTLAPYGRVWSTGQEVAFAAAALAYVAALGNTGARAFFWCGVATGCAFLTRSHVAFASIWPLWYLVQQSRPLGNRELVRCCLLGAVPFLAALGITGAYDWVRFGSPFDNGYAYHLMDPVFRSDFQTYGLFNLHYIPANLYYQYIFYPLPIREDSAQGGSLFLLSPVFLAAFWGIAAQRRTLSTWILVATIMLVNVPILLLMGTGWIQFGPRYTLDFTLPLLLLTAMGIRHWRFGATFALTAISVAHYLIGTFYYRP
jgi:hypothetical protein